MDMVWVALERWSGCGTRGVGQDVVVGGGWEDRRRTPLAGMRRLGSCWAGGSRQLALGMRAVAALECPPYNRKPWGSCPSQNCRMHPAWEMECSRVHSINRRLSWQISWGRNHTLMALKGLKDVVKGTKAEFSLNHQHLSNSSSSSSSRRNYRTS